MLKIALSSMATLLTVAHAQDQELAFTGFGKVEWKYDDQTDEIVITATIPDKTYFGMLLGSNSMFQTDALIFKADGDNSKAADYYSNGFW